jgi:hypothetical protein
VAVAAVHTALAAQQMVVMVVLVEVHQIAAQQKLKVAETRLQQLQHKALTVKHLPQAAKAAGAVVLVKQVVRMRLVKAVMVK